MDSLCGIDIQIAPGAPMLEDQASGFQMATDITALIGNCILMMHQSGGIATGAGSPDLAIVLRLFACLFLVQAKR